MDSHSFIAASSAGFAPAWGGGVNGGMGGSGGMGGMEGGDGGAEDVAGFADVAGISLAAKAGPAMASMSATASKTPFPMLFFAGVNMMFSQVSDTRDT